MSVLSAEKASDVLAVEFCGNSAQIAAQRLRAATWQWSGVVEQDGIETEYEATMPRRVEETDVIHMLCRQLLGSWHVKAEALGAGAMSLGGETCEPDIESGWRVSVSRNENDWETLPATLRFENVWRSSEESELLGHVAAEDVRTAAEVLAVEWLDALEEPKPRKKRRWWSR